MKLVVFAHVPPPHHGQSQMVKLLLEGFGGDARRNPHRGAHGMECYHVDCRLSNQLEQIGQPRTSKLLPLVRFCFQAIWLRFCYGAKNFYFIPATGCRLGMLRDWITMALCRPFFRRIIFHWEAAGLGVWLQNQARPWERWVSRWLLFRPHLSIVLGNSTQRDAQAVESRQVAIVPNGLPDPCPTFDHEVLPDRLARAASRLRESACGATRHVFSVLFMSLCCREKGLFDLLEAVALANRKLAETSSTARIRLTVAGTFWRESERAEFEKRITQPDLALDHLPGNSACGRAVQYMGFVQGREKERVLTQSDCFCFPTHYSAESFGLVLLEAMAFGLPIIATRWQNIPELLPAGYPGLVEPHNPPAIANTILNQMKAVPDSTLRNRFLELYTAERFIAGLAAALARVDVAPGHTGSPQAEVTKVASVDDQVAETSKTGR